MPFRFGLIGLSSPNEKVFCYFSCFEVNVVGKIDEYRLRRYNRILKRLDADDDDEGKWITTENNHKVHLNENGEPDKGNPHVIEAMGASDAIKEYSNRFHEALRKAKESISNYNDLSSAVYALPKDVVIEVDGVVYKRNAKTNSIDATNHSGWLRPSSLLYAKKVEVYKDETAQENSKPEEKEVNKEAESGTNIENETNNGSDYSVKPFKIKHPEASFSQKRKNDAVWDKSGGAEADKLLRPLTEKVWKNADKDTRFSLYRYTTDKDYGYGDINRMMREGAPEFWTNNDRAIVGDHIKNITKAIDKSSSPRDMWLQRGCSTGSLGKLFNVPKEKYSKFGSMSPEEIMNTLASSATYGQDKAFMSCGSGKNKGTLDEVILNIYCPKGTKMLYAEPFSAWGNGGKRDWDGKKKQSTYSAEDETILQRGTMVVPRKVTKSNGRIYVDVDVIGQEY